LRKQYTIALSVPQPCQEDWDKMTLEEKGRHCSNCNKTVVDFSLYTDKELFNFFSNPNSNVCGRFNNYQLNRPILIHEQGRFSFFNKLFYGTALASWLAILFAPDAKGSNPVTVEQKLKNKEERPNVSDTSKQYVSGIVIDAKGKNHIPYVTVTLIQAPKCEATTDSNGSFKLRIPDSLVGKKVTITMYNPDYSEREVTFIANQLPVHKVISLKYDPVNMHRTMGVPMQIETPKDTK
jgi:hypothetical protein